ALAIQKADGVGQRRFADGPVEGLHPMARGRLAGRQSGRVAETVDSNGRGISLTGLCDRGDVDAHARIRGTAEGLLVCLGTAGTECEGLPVAVVDVNRVVYQNVARRRDRKISARIDVVRAGVDGIGDAHVSDVPERPRERGMELNVVRIAECFTRI